MSLAELLPLVDNLSQPEKLQLMKFLAAQLPNAEIQTFFSAQEYPIGSLYESFEAADVLMQMVKDDRKTSANG